MATGRTTPALLAVLLGACGSTVGEADAVTAPGRVELAAPTALAAEPTGPDAVRLTWHHDASAAARFVVERRLLRRCADNYARAGAEAVAACAGPDTAWHVVATPPASTRSWTDDAALPNREHAYRVGACDGDGSGARCLTAPAVSATTFAEVAGTVSTADGKPLPPLTVTLRATDGTAASADVDAGGGFRVALPSSAPGWSELEVAGDDPGGAPYFPTLLRLDALELASPLRVLLVPRAWTVERGRYAGTTVPISLDAAFDAPVAVGSFYQVAPTADRYAALLYAWDVPFPLPLRFDRAGSDRTIAAADSLAWWKGVDRLEEIVGRDLFRPASGPAAGPAVSVRLDRTLTQSGVGAPFTHQPPERRMQEAAGWHGNVAAVASLTIQGIDSARVTIQTSRLLANTFLASHELIHVFGIGHGCSWPSIMADCAGSNHQTRTDDPTAQDVAYMELFWAIVGRRRAEDAWTEASVLGALAGERVLLKHEPPFHDPLPACWPRC